MPREHKKGAPPTPSAPAAHTTVAAIRVSDYVLGGPLPPLPSLPSVHDPSGAHPYRNRASGAEGKPGLMVVKLMKQQQLLQQWW